MINGFPDFQKLGQSNVETAVRLMGDMTKNWQSLASEMTDYSKRSFEEGTQTFEKLLGARSVEQAIEIQTSFAKRAYDDYMHQVTKIGGIYADLAKEAYRPIERVIQSAR